MRVFLGLVFFLTSYGFSYATESNAEFKLKASYDIEKTSLEIRDKSLIKTDRLDNASSYICQMTGQGITVDRNLRLELRARAVTYKYKKKYSLGYIAITRNGEILKIIKPLSTNYYIYPLSEWKSEDAENTVYTGAPNKDETIVFDLLSGSGTMHRHDDYLKENGYQLSHCKRIKRSGLPIYKYVQGTS